LKIKHIRLKDKYGESEIPHEEDWNLFASPFFLQTQNTYEKGIHGQGYDVEEMVDSDEATEQEEEAM
jgi:hypothetical protein